MTDEKRFDVGQFGNEIKRLMVVAAHPDDLETACGGTVALLIKQEELRLALEAQVPLENIHCRIIDIEVDKIHLAAILSLDPLDDRRQRLASFRADGSHSSSHEQPAVRLFTSSHPDRQRRSATNSKAAPLAYRRDHEIHRLHRSDQFDLRLHDLRDDVVHF